MTDKITDRLEALAEHLGFSVDGEPGPDPDEPDWFGPVTDARLLRWSSRCPDRFIRATLDDLDPVIGDPVTGWATNPAGRNLVLCGGVGTGKTHAALAAARHRWLDAGDDVLFRPVVELLDELRPGAETDVLPDAMGVDVLVLDDLGAERPTDWTAERLFAVVNRRWMDRRPVIATTNLDPPGLRAAIGDRTYSRLMLDGAVVVGVTGNDRRRR